MISSSQLSDLILHPKSLITFSKVINDLDLFNQLNQN
jgi:hypothetical protein